MSKESKNSDNIVPLELPKVPEVPEPPEQNASEATKEKYRSELCKVIGTQNEVLSQLVGIVKDQSLQMAELSQNEKTNINRRNFLIGAGTLATLSAVAVWAWTLTKIDETVGYMQSMSKNIEIMTLTITASLNNMSHNMQAMQESMQNIDSKMSELEIMSTQFKQTNQHLNKIKTEMVDLRKSVDSIDRDKLPQMTQKMGQIVGRMYALEIGMNRMNGNIRQMTPKGFMKSMPFGGMMPF